MMPSRHRTLAPALLICVVFILLSTYHYTQTSVASYESSAPLHHRAGSYGVGLDLTTSYGTAAIHYHHEFSSAIAKVNGTADYIRMMERLSMESAWRVCPPYLTVNERAADAARQLKRRFRKYLGQPASPEVALLAGLLQSLRYEVEQVLGHNLESFIVTFPRIAGLCEEDVTDAIGYIGLRPLQLPPLQSSNYIHQPYELEASYMGSGLGLCSHYTEPKLCNEEADKLPVDNVLSIHYSRHALSVETKSISRIGNTQELYAFSPYREPRQTSWSSPIDFMLGADSLPSSTGSQNAYWYRVRKAIQRDPYASRNQLRRNITYVLLQGESALNTKFLQVLQEALQEIAGDEAGTNMYDPIYVAAKGAAVMAMRIQETLRSGREGSSEGKQGL